MKILILGAAGQIAKVLRQRILDETDHSLVLYARHADQRLTIQDVKRETIITGDFQEYDKLVEALSGVDFVYLNAMGYEDTVNVVNAMKEANAKYIVGANILGIYDEVIGEFGKWNTRMFGKEGIPKSLRQSADTVENSGLAYTILRLTWLYDEGGNENYQISDKGDPFIGAQVTRQAVARLIMDIIQDPDKYARRNLGVSEPNTDWPKPSFYR